MSATQLDPTARPPDKQELERLSGEDAALLGKLLTEKAEFVWNELFDDPDAEIRLFGAGTRLVHRYATVFHPLPYEDRTAVLSLDMEKSLFMKYNYVRLRMFRILEDRGGRKLGRVQTRYLLAWSKRRRSLRSEIVQANIALVLAMLKRTGTKGMDFEEMVSEGNMALLRSVEKFDCARGFKFSTYSCRAILKAFSRVAMRTSRHRGRFPTEFDPSLERSDYVERMREGIEVEHASEVRGIVADNRADLSSVEMTVILERFAFTDPDGPARGRTLEQVGVIIDVTKERVRQIQNRALGKIRAVLEEEIA